MIKKIVSASDLPSLRNPVLFRKVAELGNDRDISILVKVRFDRFLRSIYPEAGSRKYGFFWSGDVVSGNEITDPELLTDLQNLVKKRAFNPYGELHIDVLD